MRCILLGKNDTSREDSDPETSSRTPSLTPSEILYAGFLYVFFLFLSGVIRANRFDVL